MPSLMQGQTSCLATAPTTCRQAGEAGGLSGLWHGAEAGVCWLHMERWCCLVNRCCTCSQGVEFYQGCPIIYGAGGAVDDYALDEDYRNDLGGVWVAVMGAQGECSGGTSLVEEGPTTPPQPPGVLRLGGAATSAAGASSAASAGGNARTPAAGGGGRAARLASLQLLPTRITHLWRAGESLPEGCGLPPYVARVNVARGSDHIWVAQTMRRLCRRWGVG